MLFLFLLTAQRPWNLFVRRYCLAFGKAPNFMWRPVHRVWPLKTWGKDWFSRLFVLITFVERGLNCLPMLFDGTFFITWGFAFHFFVSPTKINQLHTLMCIVLCTFIVIISIYNSFIIMHQHLIIKAVSYTHLTLPTNREV